jgi:predicted HTH domain antitoxin
MLSITLDLPAEITADEARLLLALKLYEEHRVSLGKAAEVAGYSKSAFMELAGKHGVCVFDYEPGDLDHEASM